MKKLIISAFAALCLIQFTPVLAATASGEDNNVSYTYWDQGNIYTFWSGVYNKINYNNYKPCVGSNVGIGGGCGAIAWQGVYQEHAVGLRVFGHYHYLESGYGTQDYVVK